MSRRAIVAALLVVVACQGSLAQRAIVIPRYRGRPDTASERYMRYMRGMNYDPTDWPIVWPTADTLIVAHVEHYSDADVAAATCGGSGLFAIPLSAGSARPLAVGEPLCRAVEGNGIALDRSSGLAFASVNVPVNQSKLVRIRLRDGAMDTISTACRVYAEDVDVSTDGARLVFRGLCSGRDQENWELYTIGSDGQALRQVRGEPGYDSYTPRWSADGRRLAYVRERGKAGDRVEEIAVIDTSGSGRHVIARGHEPAWSPDGRWVAYIPTDSAGRLPGSIRIVHPDGADDHEIFRNRERSTYSRGWGPLLEGQPGGRLVWSPDGQWIAFSRRYNSGASVWRVQVHTAASHPVTQPDR
jgi:Tol biopolymer transport system component